MIFVQFVKKEDPDKSLYFIGTNLAAILTDTNNGTKFGIVTLASYQEISREKAKELDLKYLEKSIQSIGSGRSTSLLLGQPQ